MKWRKIEYPWKNLQIPDSKIDLRMGLFNDFVDYFGFDQMAWAESVGSYERLLYGKRSYNNVANSCYYLNGWKKPERVPDDDHGIVFKTKGTSRIVHVSQPYAFDRVEIEEWCDKRELIYVICDKKYSFYYPDNTDMVLLMSKDTYIDYLKIPRWPLRWEGAIKNV